MEALEGFFEDDSEFNYEDENDSDTKPEGSFESEEEMQQTSSNCYLGKDRKTKWST